MILYAPCGLGAKQSLWNSLLGRILVLNGERVCVCGDFNAVRCIEERRSARAGSHSSDHIPFNRFIDDAVLIDLPLSGRKFTWYKGDGLAMSRIDRFLLSEEWCLTWPNCVQVAQLRGLSDHCPLVLEADEENWGPRPSRMLKCWKDIPGYQQFVRDKWKAMQIDGWGGFVLKEKFKMIRLALKEWHAAHSQNLPGRIDSLKVRLSALEVKGEAVVLSEAEFEELHGLTSEIHSLSRRSASICWQQSRSLWLKEGDANSKYFHSVVASRRRGNAVSSIQVDGVTTEGVQPIRQAVFEHFASHFKESQVARPGVDKLQFKRLTLLEGGSLTKPFSLEEVKIAVWDCDSFKSLGPDGINFGFIKDFWSELQADVMRFIADFHRNGKLTKGLNSTFIALIPKVDSPQRLNDFRPISLVGSLYKILAKVLANRLRLVIGSVISESQTAFVKDRQILDGILIANEAVDDARGDPRRLGFWEPVLTRIQNRLSGWKSRFLSFGGRLVLLKSVLTSMPVYALSFFKAPSGKWCWRMLVDRGGLWFRVLAARYGVERGCVREGGRNGSAWWREIVRIRDGVDGLGGRWFGEGVVRKVGDGTESYFWTDPWLGGTPMCARFGRLFELAVNKSSTAQLSDTWIWRIDPVSGYSVRGAYQLLTSHPSDPLDGALDLIWHKQRLRIAWLDAEAWRQLNTYLFHAVPLVLSGHPLGRGLASLRWIRKV
ncbi:hypothetical protein TSUD_180540 [Trifolium subterraneum]|uniref:Endonuclease/exonuclease/phosphatase domain-containing protein n=1 Tax=Trifolium subterraneum TaxID=3900 RepID=A0A2Z6PAY7_TRISU|nr:hypothetical protein TSUD_180540 [Trifolium subterraneum]